MSNSKKPVYVTEQDEPIEERVIANARYDSTLGRIAEGQRDDGKLRRARIEGLLSDSVLANTRYQALNAAQSAAAGYGSDWTKQPKVRREVDSVEIEELPGNRVRVTAEYAPVKDQPKLVCPGEPSV